ncbi:hypothetical protein MSAN_00996200 [Mycena sanguinolenta]|uniref:Uncharacterized protein n=1 Tax=Mycena sanguinolenta TaxID=230812 RepID=A0A8H6YLQ1_9AGAR|nr:hypothetical protein MSAN_00996200 [Mycena sanguinolenta]
MSSRSRAGGLPSGPGPRARSVTRTRDADRSRYDDDSDGGASSRSSARQVRPQKSMTSMNQSRSERSERERPPMPSSRSRRPTYESSRSDSGTNRSSDTSTTSSASSFLDRMKQTAGYASSRTSLDDDEPDYKRSARTTRRPARRDSSPPPGTNDETETETHGDTLWSRIATSATSLTVNVSKAWATNITTFAGEETPVGQESRLTRAMKAYHLEKARDPSDLPAWLFDEKERRRRPEPEPTRSRRRKDDYDDSYETVEKTQTRAEPPPSRGLRDIYAAAAASSSSTAPSARSTRGARSYDDSPQPSRATDRLKALRDAKRGVVNPMREEERVPEPEPEPAAPPPRRRVGLPSGPVSRR